ncbi:MAG: peptidoglycan DD-metalloendopeptidase family protein [Oscillospiraceae bacterium]|nr:peptidoglycan DD-metalloendopeptidase family protein [Oscillospiraceae bacterium]
MNKRKLFVSLMAGFLAVVLTLGLVAGVLPYFVSAASSSEIKTQLDQLKDDKKKIESEIKALEGQLSSNLDNMEAIVNQKNTIDQQIFMLYEQMANINEQIAAYGNLIADKQEELEKAEARLAELNAKNKERIRAMEEDGGLSYWSVLFKASSFADLLDRLNMVQDIAAADRRRIKELSDAAEAVANTKASLQSEKAALEENKKELAASQEIMEIKRVEADNLLAELLKSEEEYQELLDKAEAEAGKLADDIDDLEDAYDAAKREEWLATSVPPSTSGSSSGSAPTGGKWVMPVKYQRVSSVYGWRVHPVHKDWRFHYGIDLAASKGTPIVATRSGVVEFAKYSSSAGYYVKIDHQDGFDSVYMHMTHYIVKKGDKVSAGQVIGYVGSTGTSTGNHLHFAIMYNGSYVNPADYLNF